MKVITSLTLCLLLGACGVSGQGAGAAATASPTDTPGAAVGAPLSLWNESEQRHEIRLVDVATGQTIPGFILSTTSDDPSYALPATVSPDGQTVVAVGSQGQRCEPFAGGSSCRPGADVLYLGHLGDRRQITVPLPGQGWLGPVAFHPAAPILALVILEAKSYTLLLFDTNTGKLSAQRALDFRPSLVGYDAAGTTLVVYGAPLAAEPGVSEPGSPQVVKLDAATLAVQWQRTLQGIVSGSWCEENCTAPHEQRLFAHWSPAVLLSHDGRKLYLLHTDEAQLTTVDLAAHQIHRLELQAGQQWLDGIFAFTAGKAYAKGGGHGAFKAAVLSPDGTRLYVLGRQLLAEKNAEGYWDTREESLGLQVVEVERGQVLATGDAAAHGIKLSPDGAWLLLEGWNEQGAWTEVRDAQTLESRLRLTGWEMTITRQIDGRPVVLGRRLEESATQLAVLDAESFEIVNAWRVKGYASWVAIP